MEDANAHCRERLDSPNRRLRAAAFAGVLRQPAPRQGEALLLQAFADCSAAVQRLAARSVERGGLAPSLDALLAIHLAAPAVPRMKAMLRAAALASPWRQLPFLLDALRDGVGIDGVAADGVRCLLTQGLRHWQPGFTTPTDAERIAVQMRWPGVAPTIPAEIASLLAVRLARYDVAVAR